MIKSMNFNSLKTSLTRKTRKQQSSQCDGVCASCNENGVTTDENKDETGDTGQLPLDHRQPSSVSATSKHKKKKGKPGLWKTLRHKLTSNNRQCWEGGDSQSQSDDSDVSIAAATRQCDKQPKASGVYPMVSSVNQKNTSVRYTICSDDQLEGSDQNGRGARETSSGFFSRETGAGGFENSVDSRHMNQNLTESGDGNDEFYSREYYSNNHCNGVSPPSLECGDANLQQMSLCVQYEILDTPTTPRSLTKELFKLSKYGWYWGPITRTEAEEKLIDQPDGAFLVRDSSDDRHLLSLSFRSYRKTLHTRIEHCNGLFSFYAQPEPEGHASIVDLIEHSMNYSQSGAFCYSRARSPGSPSFPVRLTKPVSRFTQVRTLQYLCRFVIRQYTRFDHIQVLPLPSRIKGYIEEGHY